MAVTYEYVGKTGGGGKADYAPKNVVISRGAGFTKVGEITVEKPSTVGVSIEHNNTNSFRNTQNGAVVAIRWGEGTSEVFYGGNYYTPTADGTPFSMTFPLPAGTYDIQCTLNTSVPSTLSSYTVTGMRTIIVPD